ncbi:MarR family winged helix-turn-helix transcriptional regulator [Rhodococcus sp. SORGH_AS_0303]|uniref:MarR family winged helix-turn-helix transcriptional regulator n=1 Tax=Rhodococcus sp. SORGH_AS_0303 TaxID=3041753 RepID=UPI00277DD150|nr:MarR family transcriptional regulator [Rhodococcus sp. SORGH_AS_0303]MDQ1202812.1 DNA-binding MarR family transcriptional regulator [Rhodococcus sp. SORGH_AS_0303]
MLSLVNDALTLDKQLCFALYSASRATTAVYRPLLDDLGITYPQYLVMLVLWERDGLSVSELGDRLGLDSGTLSPLLKRIETLSLVTRERSAEDERRVEIRLTDTGRALRSAAAHVPECIFTATGLTEDEATTLIALVRKTTASLRSA